MVLVGCFWGEGDGVGACEGVDVDQIAELWGESREG